MSDVSKLSESDKVRQATRPPEVVDLEKRISHAADPQEVNGSKKFGDATRIDSKIEQEFARKFGDGRVPGGDKVWIEAHNGSPTEKKGNELQMAVANQLGPDNLAEMERSFRPLDGKHDSPIDLVTKDDIVIECKNYKNIDPSDLKDFVKQAKTRLGPDASGHTQYRDAIIVVPDGKLSESGRAFADDMRRHRNIRICTMSELPDALNQIRSQT